MSDWWIDYPWRLIQTNLRQIDMRDIRASQVVRDLQDFKATVLMINAAGIIASYPTQIPYHFQSPYLSGDSLLEILDACHAAGMRVIARTDFSKVRRPVYEQHPDWAYRSARGQIVEYNGDVHVCLNSWYQQEGTLNILQELFDTHPFDGVFFNMGGYVTQDYSGKTHGPCRCQSCQQRFYELSGLPLPEPVPDSDETYIQFKRRTRRAQEEKVYTFLAERYPHLCIANHLGFRRGFIRQEANTALDRPLPLWQYSASENTRWAVGSYPTMLSSSTTVDFIDFPYRHTAVSPHEQGLRLAQSLANGGALDFYLIGRLDNHRDRSGFQPIREIFHYHAGHEADYRGLRSRAEIALLKPAAGDRLPGGQQAEYRGWLRALVENHFPFDVLTQDSALHQPWERYRLLILPGIAQLSPELAQAIDDFVASGGRLVASGKTALRSALAGGNGDAPALPALESLGIEQVRLVRKDMRSSYFQVLDKTSFPRLVDSDLVYLDGPYLYAQYKPEAQPFLQLIPPHQFGPPERCYFEQVTEHPGYIRHPYGRGWAIYLPWLPGRQLYQHGQINTAWFMADLLEGAAGISALGGNLPAQVEATLLENAAGDWLLHLVNTSGHFGNSYYKPLVIRDLEAALPWAGEPPTEVRALCSGQEASFRIENERLYLRLPELGVFEAVRITPAARRMEANRQAKV